MKIADLDIKDQEFGETTKEPGLVRTPDLGYYFYMFMFVDFCTG